MQKRLITLGIVLVVPGPRLAARRKARPRKAPGRHRPAKREGFTFYFPLTTSILVSLVLTLLFWIFRR
ncbi:MAG: DUF2905 domain-containing protein [Burkholderiales bacterium]|nr:DUF2905 domain-containing protein [Burkholderiales bacterium]